MLSRVCEWSRPNVGPHGAFKAPLPHRDWNVQVIGYELRGSPLRRARVKKARESVYASGWDRLGTWLGRSGSRDRRLRHIAREKGLACFNCGSSEPVPKKPLY